MNIKVIKDDETTVEVMAQAIIAISEGIKKLRSSRLNDNALFLLIQNAAPRINDRPPRYLSKREIKATLDGIQELERAYIKKKPA